MLSTLAGAAIVYPTPVARVAVFDAHHWALVALVPGGSHILTSLPGFGGSNYGVYGNELAEVYNGNAGCVLRTFSLKSGHPLTTVQVRGLRIIGMKEGPVRGVVFTGQCAVFPAGTGINLLGCQFMVVVNLKTHLISRFPPPHRLRLSDYPAAVPGGLAWCTSRGRAAIFLAKQKKFRLVGGLRVNHARLVYVPSYGLVAWNFRGMFHRLTDLRLQPVRARVRQLPGHVMMYGLQASRVEHRASIVYYADRSGAVGGKPRKATTIISAYDLVRNRLTWRVRFDFRADAWFGVSPHGRTLCMADYTHHSAVLYSVRPGRLFHTPLSHVDLYNFRVLSVRRSRHP